MLLNQPFTNYISSASQDTFYLHRRQLFEAKTAKSCELQMVRLNGTRFEAQLESIVLMDEAGETCQIQSALLDITERKRLQDKLNEERNLLRTVVDHLPAYVYVKDIDRRFIMGNVAVAQVMGAQSPDELIGKTDFDFYPETLATEYYANERMVIRTGQPLIDKIEPLIDPAGRRRWLSTTKLPLRNSAGETVGLVGIGRDITEQNRYERRIKLLQTITQNISEAPNFQAALTSTLNNIGQMTNWDYGEAWILDEAKQVLTCSPAWYGSHEKLEQFRAQSENLALSKNVGLPGRA